VNDLQTGIITRGLFKTQEIADIGTVFVTILFEIRFIALQEFVLPVFFLDGWKT
jgi:hypothetical protein